MNKIKTIGELTEIVAKLKESGKTVGLVTGCFDVLHFGHIELFRFAKGKVDCLIVGLDNDESIKLSKGKKRPIFGQRIRMNTLSDLNIIDFIFPIEFIAKFSSKKIDSLYEDLVKKLSPNAIITNLEADSYWKNKKKIANNLGINFLGERRKRKKSSSAIIKTLSKV